MLRENTAAVYGDDTVRSPNSPFSPGGHTRAPEKAKAASENPVVASGGAETVSAQAKARTKFAGVREQTADAGSAGSDCPEPEYEEPKTTAGANGNSADDHMASQSPAPGLGVQAGKNEPPPYDQMDWEALRAKIAIDPTGRFVQKAVYPKDSILTPFMEACRQSTECADSFR
jgi:hypothetical protein